MSAKELTKLTLTDLWKGPNGFWDVWDRQEEAVKEVRRRFMEGALEAEREMLVAASLMSARPTERAIETATGSDG
ncbi:MAG: hypothetical protein M0Z48_13280 [Nitrospiraceae bacterium]|nr:hypothetical protein [Nitrospiraceae bacterium]